MIKQIANKDTSLKRTTSINYDELDKHIAMLERAIKKMKRTALEYQTALTKDKVIETVTPTQQPKAMTSHR